MPRFGQKAIDCLKMAALHETGFSNWTTEYQRLGEIYSEKAVCVKMQELADRGYVEYGVSARTGWLTNKGALALQEALADA